MHCLSANHRTILANFSDPGPAFLCISVQISLAVSDFLAFGAGFLPVAFSFIPIASEICSTTLGNLCTIARISIRIPPPCLDPLFSLPSFRRLHEGHYITMQP